jgi:hypothetical protein
MENCPKCNAKLAPPLKSSGRQICSACGWAEKKVINANTESLAAAEKISPRGNWEFLPVDVLEVAENQQRMILLILLGLARIALNEYISFALAIIQVYCVYKLAVAVRYRPPVLYGLLMLIPLISLLVLLRVNARATAILKAHGIRVGLGGANHKDLENLRGQVKNAT